MSSVAQHPPQDLTEGALSCLAADRTPSRGRLHPEPESRTRSVHQRDRDRIIHSAAFRRLKLKTQVFVYHEGDSYRTRLTHSLEVAQIARSVSRFLGLNEDLAEAVALAHDLGHPPFGHAGEDALNAAMRSFGGFDHNDQTMRILTFLERRYAEFDGLNLTWETLEGVAKHNGPLAGPLAGRPPIAADSTIARHDEVQPLDLDSHPGLEAQIAAMADDIAYNNHDIDDGLRAGLFTIEALAEVPLVGPVFASVKSRYPELDEPRMVHECVRRMISMMVEDLIAETTRRARTAGVRTCGDVRLAGRPIAGFSAEMMAHDRALRTFLFDNMYRHFRVNRMTSKARRVIHDLFGLFLEEPECLPPDWASQTDGRAAARTARAVCDYVGGMTDRFALDEHHRLFDVYARG